MAALPFLCAPTRLTSTSHPTCSRITSTYPRITSTYPRIPSTYPRPNASQLASVRANPLTKRMQHVPRGVQHDARRHVRVRAGVSEPTGVPAPMGALTQYADSWFDRAFMTLFRRKMEQQIGGPSSSRPGADAYEAFVDVSRRVMTGRTAEQQREIVANVLRSLLPPNAPATFRALFPPTQFSAELNAAITVPFFQWLVGPCRREEVEVEGRRQNSGVKIMKCRYLEVSGCVGMCVNMCKLPTQEFFTNEFGLPLTMTPNFEDMSCEMVFGQMPPPLSEDPALNQPCFATLCSMAQPESSKCPRVPEIAP